MEDKIIFLDFDGVLFDTLKEVYLLNRAIYKGISYLDNVDNDYEMFSKYKFLVYNIWMFYYYNKIIFSKTKEEDIIDKFMLLLENRDYKKEEDFCLDFLSLRKDLSNNHYEYWKNLETPYDFFFKIKKIFNQNANIVIVSKKNKSSIIERFKTYDFNLDEKFIFAREILDKYPNKTTFINEYMQKHGFKKAIFVDDNMNNLKPNQNENIKTVLALWGNSGINQKGYSQNEAVDIITSFLNISSL